MIRGERLPLAIWTVNSRTEKKNTTKLSMAAAISPTSARAPSNPKSKNDSFNISSKPRVKGAQIIAASMARTGTTHNEVFRNSLNRFRRSQDMEFVSHHRCSRYELAGGRLTALFVEGFEAHC